MSYPPLDAGPRMSDEQVFRYSLFLVGVRDPGTVARLWAEERARREAGRARQPKRRRR